MAFSLDNINSKVKENPKAFAEGCEKLFNAKVNTAATMIVDRLPQSRVVLLSGPSGSGKTTTAKKICDVLESRGIRATSISMDKYYNPPDPDTMPLTAEGEVDRESPLCLDLDLLRRHFSMIERGEEIVVPHFSFRMQALDPSRFEPLKLGSGEIVIFEGIHALNDLLADAHPQAFKLYISARSDVMRDGRIAFKRTWIRLLRRVVRDELFRGTGATETLKMWANVRRGEKQYISPFKQKADLLFDSSMEYEISVMKRHAQNAFHKLPDTTERIGELRSLLPVLAEFEDIDTQDVPTDSILREFIGGGVYTY